MLYARNAPRSRETCPQTANNVVGGTDKMVKYSSLEL